MDIAARLSNLAGDEDVKKFNLHVKELESVHSLVLGLAARLAKAEENIELLKYYNSEKYAYVILLVRKKDKQVEQLAEAQWLKENIDRRSTKVKMTATCFLLILRSLYFQIERSIEKYLGAEVLEKLKEYVKIKEELIGERKELAL